MTGEPRHSFEYDAFVIATPTWYTRSSEESSADNCRRGLCACVFPARRTWSGKTVKPTVAEIGDQEHRHGPPDCQRRPPLLLAAFHLKGNAARSQSIYVFGDIMRGRWVQADPLRVLPFGRRCRQWKLRWSLVPRGGKCGIASRGPVPNGRTRALPWKSVAEDIRRNRARRSNVPNIVFTTRLTEADWDDTLRGWRCPPLAVPGAIVEALYVEGNRTNSARYEVLQEQSLIRWTPSDAATTSCRNHPTNGGFDTRH